jgi:hypothetical protein
MAQKRAHSSKKATIQSKENLDVDCFTVLVDKSYQNGRELQCISNNITTIEAHPALGTSKESVKQPDYLVAKFKYNAVIDLSPRKL